MTAKEEELKKNRLKTADGAASGFRYDPYEESDAVRQAAYRLAQQTAQKPGAYQSQWQTQLSDTLGRILNREPFSYDLNGDALYRQYKDQAVHQGRLAMEDTMGRAAALTGGYGNSYAQSVGQQTYQGYLESLNDRIPELYRLALSRYQLEGDDLSQRYAMLGAQENQDYSRYRDTVSDWNTELDRLQSRYDTERNLDYGRWADDRDFGFGQYVDDRDYRYRQERDKIADEQWQAEFDEAIRQFDVLHSRKSSGGGGSGRRVSEGGETEEEAESRTPTWGEVASTAKKMVAYGRPKDSVNAYIDAARQSGAISSAQAKSLKVVAGV